MSKALIGKLSVSGDKSLSHRVAIFSAMAEGRSQVQGLLDSADLRSTLGVLRALGAQIDLQPDAGGLSGSICGWGRGGPNPAVAPKPERGNIEAAEVDAVAALDCSNSCSERLTTVLDCGNSGTTARLMLGVLSGYGVSATLVGDSSLSKRPMRRVTEPLELMGARFASADKLPITVGGSVGRGDRDAERNASSKKDGECVQLCKFHGVNQTRPKLTAINYQSPVASAQVKSAILLAGLNAEGKTSVSEPHKSRDHTELMLPAYGVQVETCGLSVSLEGGQQLHSYDCSVPGDPSSAAFMLVAAAMTYGSDVVIENVLLNPTRTGFLRVMQDMGASVDIWHNKDAVIGAELVGSVRVCYRSGIGAIRVPAESIATLIDEIPILALLASTAKGETVFEQVGELRVKESDRLSAIIDGLHALGVEAWTEQDDLHIIGCYKRTAATPRKNNFATHGDHRLAMTWAIAERAFELELNISDRDCVKVSYPTFFEHLRRLS